MAIIANPKISCPGDILADLCHTGRNGQFFQIITAVERLFPNAFKPWFDLDLFQIGKIRKCSFRYFRDTRANDHFFYFTLDRMPGTLLRIGISATRRSNRKAVAILRIQEECTVSINSQYAILKFPADPFSCHMVHFLSCISGIAVNGIKIHHIFIGGIINDFFAFYNRLTAADRSSCGIFLADPVSFSINENIMECTASQSILFRSASFCLIVVFFPGNHKAVVIHLCDFNAHKGFSGFCIIGQ